MGGGAWEPEAGVDHRSIMARKDEPQNTHILLCVVLKQRYKIPVERERGREGEREKRRGIWVWFPRC